MAVSARSYGTAAKVAALTPRYLNAGAYDTTTAPTLATVEGWIDDVSALLNVSLARAGFAIPVSQADCVLVLAAIVVEEVADLAHSTHNAGKFFTERSLARGEAPMAVIRKEMMAWVDDNADGLEALGAARTTNDNRKSTLSAGVICIEFAEHGDGTSEVE